MSAVRSSEAQFAPVAGRISMDWTTLDVSGIEGVSVGDEVILIGEQGDACDLGRGLASATGRYRTRSHAASTAAFRVFTQGSKSKILEGT